MNILEGQLLDGLLLEDQRENREPLLITWSEEEERQES